MARLCCYWHLLSMMCCWLDIIIVQLVLYSWHCHWVVIGISYSRLFIGYADLLFSWFYVHGIVPVRLSKHAPNLADVEQGFSKGVHKRRKEKEQLYVKGKQLLFWVWRKSDVMTIAENIFFDALINAFKSEWIESESSFLFWGEVLN